MIKTKKIKWGAVVLSSMALSSCFFNKVNPPRTVPSDVSAADKAQIESVIKQPLSSGAKLVIADSNGVNAIGKFYIASNLPDGTLLYVILRSKEPHATLYRYSTTLINQMAPIFDAKLAQGDQPPSGKYDVMVADAVSRNQINFTAKAALDALPKTTETVDPLFVDLNRKVYAQKEIDL